MRVIIPLWAFLKSLLLFIVSTYLACRGVCRTRQPEPGLTVLWTEKVERTGDNSRAFLSGLILLEHGSLDNYESGMV